MAIEGAVAFNKRLTWRKGILQEPINGSDKSVRCLVCPRSCILKKGARGFCRNRANVDGTIYVYTYGLLSAVESRPIEIKPFFHYWPGSTALTFSGWGCNFRCPWCQNFHLSWEEPRPEFSVYMDPGELVKTAIRYGDEGICASFNEPGIHLEYVVDSAEKARAKGLYATMVTNGYLTTKALDKLIDAGVDGFSMDIKGCPDTYSKLLAADPDIVIKNAKRIKDRDAHVEMVFLVVPGANDSEECVEWVLSRLMDYLGPDTPIHINRYYPANRWREPPTRIQLLESIARKARDMGFDFVYIGNTGIPEHEETRCPRCGKVLVTRVNYRVISYNIANDKRCPRCGYRIPVKGRPVLKLW